MPFWIKKIKSGFVVEDDVAVEKVVTTGLDTGDYIEIKGLKEGEQVIVEGQHYVEDGGKVKVVRVISIEYIKFSCKKTRYNNDDSFGCRFIRNNFTE